MDQKITVRNNQTLLDISVQETGAYEAVIGLMRVNNLPVTEVLEAGAKLLPTDLTTENIDVKGYYKGKNLRPATGATNDVLNGGAEGISVWGINDDFIISE